MPILQLQVSGTPCTPTTLRLAGALADLTHSILGKDRALTAVAVSWVPADHWFIAGESLAESGRASFALDIRITDETNTKAEKARYIEAVFGALSAILGPVDARSYIHVHDVRAAAYGYGGRTQEFRFHHPA